MTELLRLGKLIMTKTVKKMKQSLTPDKIKKCIKRKHRHNLLLIQEQENYVREERRAELSPTKMGNQKIMPKILLLKVININIYKKCL